MSIMTELERYRARRELNMTAMGKLFGVKNPYQTYKNWVMRDSLPKIHYERAAELLAQGSKKAEMQIMDVFRELSPAGKEAALQAIAVIRTLESKST